MSSLFYKLGKKAGRSLKKGQWIYKSVFGTEEEAIESEYILGQEMARRLTREFETGTSAENFSRFKALGRQAAARLTNSQRRWAFHVIPSSEVNAFALPGGFIFSTSALLSNGDLSEDELMFILGHEIGHVVRGHPFDRVLANSSIKMVSRIGRAGGVVGNLARETLVSLIRSNYSQDQELDADLFGARLMASAGYHPDYAISALKKIQSQASSESSDFHYFSTHPPLERRIKEIEYYIRRSSRSGAARQKK